MKQRRGISLHIGVNEVDPEHYGGWSGPLACCEKDAEDMIALASGQGFESSTLLTAEATREAVADAVRRAARELEAGDLFLLSYSGHGGQVPDVDGDEEDQKDETWCLHDGQILDDELNILWSGFKPGVRVWVISDSCHSGTVTKGAALRLEPPDPSLGEPRYMPREPALETFRRNRDFYALLQARLPSPRPRIQACVRLFSGCQEDQYSYESDGNGRFTAALKQHFANGEFDGDHAELHRRIAEDLGEKQQPNHFVIGGSDPEWDRQKPFQI